VIGAVLVVMARAELEGKVWGDFQSGVGLLMLVAVGRVVDELLAGVDLAVSLSSCL